ncbi:MAG: hypothetical protein ABSE73_05265 [Planctomycetota bacterium]
MMNDERRDHKSSLFIIHRSSFFFSAVSAPAVTTAAEAMTTAAKAVATAAVAVAAAIAVAAAGPGG